jgi:hypothetical protein
MLDYLFGLCPPHPYHVTTSEEIRRAFCPTPEERAKDSEALAKAMRPMTQEEIDKINDPKLLIDISAPMGYYTHGPDRIIHCPKTGYYERKNNKIKPISEEEAENRKDEVIKISRWKRLVKKMMRGWRVKND